MPFSSNSGKNYIRSIVGTPKTVLDIGAGCGTYKNMFSDMKNVHWTAVEIWEPYVEKYGLRDKYDKVIVADIRDWTPQETYDVCFCGDILEHMTAAQAAGVLEKLKACCDKVIVSIPLGHYPQDEYDGNPHEVHVEDNWSHEKVVQAFGKPKQFHIENEIGVYVYQKIRIAVYAISKNEEEFVKRFCDSAKDADLILIADTGSTDNTVSVARENGAVVHEIAIMPWRFDKAREAALALVPRNIDICISLDLDEVLAPGWREEVERLWEFGKTTRMRYQFDWSMGVKFFAEKIHARSGYHWHHPCHEYIRADKRTVEHFASTEKLIVQHLPDPTKSRGQYMDLLKMSVEEDPYCPRNAFYYARELTYYRKWQEAIVELKRYLDMPNATWAAERAYAMRLIGSAMEAIGQDGIYWYRLGCATSPDLREPWVALAEACYRKSMWEECYGAATSALKIKQRSLNYTVRPESWGYKPHDLAAISAYRLGLFEKAKQHGKDALELSTDDERLKTNLEFYNAK